MPISDQSSITGTFGPNLWLVEEMYQLFLDDPSAVDPSWHEFFADYQPASAGEGGRADATTPTAAPAPRSAPEKPAAGSASQAARPASAAEEGTTTPLRGAASAVVKNMTASLEVPTATSVRAVPAKLMADNRIVINNFLQAQPRREDLLHPPDRLRHRPGARRLPGHEPALRRASTASRRWSPRSTSTSAWRSTCPARTGQRSLVVVPIKALRGDELHPVLVGLRGRWCARPAPAR